MDPKLLDDVVKNIEKQDFKTLENISQNCSRSILMELLDGKTTLENSKDMIQKCQIVIKEYQKQLFKQIDQHE